MIPKNGSISANIEFESQPSRTYRLNLEKKNIINYCDEIEAMKQVIYKILGTERYEHIIYSWNYGIELNDLLGESVSYACSEVERRVAEALIQDERIIRVDAFSFDVSKKGTVKCLFRVQTVFGDIETVKVVNV